jgi:N-acetylneuraminic acid mutarotase
MKNVLVYSLALVIATAPLLIIPACSKSSDSSSDLVGNWAIIGDFDGNARSEAVAFTINDTVFVGTGLTASKRLADFWKYSNDKRSWTRIADFGGGTRSQAVAFSVNNKGYVGTGLDANQDYKGDMWEFDPAKNSWTAKKDFLGTPRRDAVAFIANGNAYIATGYDDNYLKDVWQYNASNDTWSQKAGIAGSKRAEATTFTINGKVYLFSGNNNGSALNDLQVYDHSTDTWTALRKLTNLSDESYDDKYTTIIRYNAASFVIDGKAYISTGENGSMNSRTWEYNPGDDTWTEKTVFSGTARTGAIGFTLNNRGFIMSGRSGTNPFDNMYEFQPSADDNDDDNQ